MIIVKVLQMLKYLSVSLKMNTNIIKFAGFYVVCAVS
jgi:hypothetical protein